MLKTILSLFLVAFAANGIAAERKLTPVLNPGCVNPICNSSKLIYIEAKGQNSTLHYLWDFTHKPTFVLTITQLESQLNIDWNQFQDYKPCSINFTFAPLYFFGIILDKIYEFNDEQDIGILPNVNNSNVIKMDSGQFDWRIYDFMDDIISNKVVYTTTSNDFRNSSKYKNGTIKMKMHAYGNEGHGDILPHLGHTENSSQIDIIFDDFPTSFDNSRFAAEFIIFSADDVESMLKLSVRKTIDDENTPGVFTINTITVKDRVNESSTCPTHGYLQWKPVVYTAAERDISNSTQVLQYNVENIYDRIEALNSTLAISLCQFCDRINNSLVNSHIVSFGFREDGFYRRTNFSSWSFLIGLGDSPADSFSLVIILVLSIGLGLPALLVLTGAFYITYRRCSQRDDDLFLTR